MIDLHTHTTASDGKLSPKELIDLAIKKNISAIAITDHDSVDGLKEAIEYSKNKKLELIPGIEFTANPGNLAKEIHIVGLFIEYQNNQLNELLKIQKEYRVINLERIIKRLNELGYDITYDEVSKYSKKDIFGRPHIAEVLMKKYNEFKDRKQVFNELLGKEGKAFFPAQAVSMKDITKTIHDAKGLAILAHPAYLFDSSDKVIAEFIRLKGDGIEVECPYDSFNNEAQALRDRFRKIAEKKKLLISGGTDFHEINGDITIGSFGITEQEYKKLKDSIDL